MNNTLLLSLIHNALPLCISASALYSLAVTVPCQVTGVTVSKAVKSGRPALRVTWTTPQSDAPISQYQVQYRRSGTTSWSSTAPVSGSTTSTYLEELVAGAEYQVRVRALSAIGNGMWSEVEVVLPESKASVTTSVGIGEQDNYYI